MPKSAAHLPIPLDEVSITFARSAGPGGQNVNKVNTKAVLRWRVRETERLPEEVHRRFCAAYSRRITREGDLVLQSQRFREAGRNAADCLEKLRAMLAAVARPPKRRKPTRPTRGSVRRRLDAKRRRSQRKRGRRMTGDE
ncbi:MAG: aminoacyl-tRNA hydrolase [Pirellulales bacterium]|nr:aminoacyl-tRNA hydrolase [Pirellulales bacterium]